MKILGLDLSLVASGVVLINDGNVELREIIKSKPNGKLPIDELLRILMIRDKIKIIVEETQPDLVMIEGLAFMARNTTALVQLAALNYLMREVVNKSGRPFVVVAPTTLKKFVTGKGNCQKDLMLLEIYKRYKEEFLDNNLADAYGLARIGLEVLQKDVSDLPKFQQEVVKLIKPQIYG